MRVKRGIFDKIREQAPSFIQIIKCPTRDAAPSEIFHKRSSLFQTSSLPRNRGLPTTALYFAHQHTPDNMGSIVLPHLETGKFHNRDPDYMPTTNVTLGWHVDQAILSEDERLVVIRFGRDWSADCMRQDEVLYRVADRVKNFAVIYLCDIDKVPDFNQMYELYDECTLMFFFRNKHMMIDLGTGDNNKIKWVLDDKQELIDIIETIYRGAKKGRGLVVSPKDYSTRHRY